MNKKQQKQLAKLQEDADFQFLYGEYKKNLRAADYTKIQVMETSISDYVQKKHKKALKFFKHYEYRAIWRHFQKEDFALMYHGYMSIKQEIMH